MSTPSEESDLTRRLTDEGGAEAARQRWLAAVAADPRVNDSHRAAAEVLASSVTVPDEHAAAADELVTFGFLFANENGSYAAVFPPGQW